MYATILHSAVSVNYLEVYKKNMGILWSVRVYDKDWGS